METEGIRSGYRGDTEWIQGWMRQTLSVVFKEELAIHLPVGFIEYSPEQLPAERRRGVSDSHRYDSKSNDNNQQNDDKELQISQL